MEVLEAASSPFTLSLLVNMFNPAMGVNRDKLPRCEQAATTSSICKLALRADCSQVLTKATQSLFIFCFAEAFSICSSHSSRR